MASKSIQPAIAPHPAPGVVKRPKRVSVCLPPDVSRRVSRFARTERRLLAPALVVLIEKGLASVDAS